MNSRTQNKIHSTYGLTQQYIFLEILAFNVIFNFEINCSFDKRHQGYFVLFGVIIIYAIDLTPKYQKMGSKRLIFFIITLKLGQRFACLNEKICQKLRYSSSLLFLRIFFWKLIDFDTNLLKLTSLIKFKLYLTCCILTLKFPL